MEERWPTSPTCSCAATCAAARPAWVRHQRRRAARREGVGLSFWYRPLHRGALRGAGRRPRAAAAVPRPHRRLRRRHRAGHGHLPGRASRPLAAQRLDFCIDTRTGRWRSTPLDALATLLGELAQQPAVDLLAGTALADGVDRRAGAGAPRGRHPAVERRAAGRAGRGRRRGAGGGRPRGAGAGAGAADPHPRGRAGPGRPRPPTGGAPAPSSRSARSPRTSCRARSSWPAARSSSSSSAAPTPDGRPSWTPPRRPSPPRPPPPAPAPTAAADADRARALAGAEAERQRAAAEIEAVRARTSAWPRPRARPPASPRCADVPADGAGRARPPRAGRPPPRDRPAHDHPGRPRPAWYARLTLPSAARHDQPSRHSRGGESPFPRRRVSVSVTASLRFHDGRVFTTGGAPYGPGAAESRRELPEQPPDSARPRRASARY